MIESGGRKNMKNKEKKDKNVNQGIEKDKMKWIAKDAGCNSQNIKENAGKAKRIRHPKSGKSL